MSNEHYAKQQFIDQRAYQLARMASVIFGTCAENGSHEFEVTTKANGKHLSCKHCEVSELQMFDNNQLAAARQIIEMKRCPDCGAAMTNKKAGTIKTVQNVFRYHRFNCGSEMALTGLNPNNSNCNRGE